MGGGHCNPWQDCYCMYVVEAVDSRHHPVSVAAVAYILDAQDT